MKTVKFLPYVLLIGLLLALAGSVGRGLAQGPEPPEGEVQPQGEVSSAATMGSKFSYQGVLKESGSPVTGSRDMTFRLYSDDTCSTQVGSDIVKSGVQVTDGLFSVELDVTHSDFNGQGLWLEVEVGGTAVVCQEILPVPYALSLRPGAQVIGEQTNGNAIYAYNTATTGGTTYGVYGQTDSGSYKASGVYGYAPTGSTFGVYGQAGGSNSFASGVFGEATAASGPTYGVRGYNASTSGRGVYGFATAASGTTYGVKGQSASTSGYGVYGAATAASGTTYGVYGETVSTDGFGVVGVQTGYSPDDVWPNWSPGGFFGGRNGVFALSKENGGYAVIALNEATSGEGGAVFARTLEAGWAGLFVAFHTGNGNGVGISAPSGNVGLTVSGGSKSAVVRATDGSRLLYSEESTEVWFSDYGFGKLQNGVTVIPIDPIFAQTVNLEEPYHVFIQVYGNAEVYVANRTSTQFEVHLRDGDPDVEFSYRIVATRLGYEGHRLERAPWADNDPNLYPEKRAEWEAQQGPVEPAGSGSP